MSEKKYELYMEKNFPDKKIHKLPHENIHKFVKTLPSEIDLKCTWMVSNENPPVKSAENVLEIGSWEGCSMTFWIHSLGAKKITCVDTWKGGITWDGYKNFDMEEVENRFDHNCKIMEKNYPVKIEKIKGSSFTVMPELAMTRENYYDLIYIDASHASRHVLYDAINSIKLLKIGGCLVFDDYLWKDGNDLEGATQGIEAFCSIYRDHYEVIAWEYQVWMKKIGDPLEI